MDTETTTNSTKARAAYGRSRRAHVVQGNSTCTNQLRPESPSELTRNHRVCVVCYHCFNVLYLPRPCCPGLSAKTAIYRFPSHVEGQHVKVVMLLRAQPTMLYPFRSHYRDEGAQWMQSQASWHRRYLAGMRLSIEGSIGEKLVQVSS